MKQYRAHKFQKMEVRNKGWLGRGSAALFDLPGEQKWTKPSEKENTTTPSHRFHSEWLVGPEHSTGRKQESLGKVAVSGMCGKPPKQPITIEGYSSSIKDNPFLKAKEQNNPL